MKIAMRQSSSDLTMIYHITLGMKTRFQSIIDT